MNKTLGFLFICLLPLQVMAEQRPTSAAALCLHVEQTDASGRQSLTNSCSQAIEAVWCNVNDNGCVKYNNQVTIGAGRSWPVGKGIVRYNGCTTSAGIKKTEGMLIWCGDTE